MVCKLCCQIMCRRHRGLFSVSRGLPECRCRRRQDRGGVFRLQLWDRWAMQPIGAKLSRTLRVDQSCHRFLREQGPSGRHIPWKKAHMAASIPIFYLLLSCHHVVSEQIGALPAARRHPSGRALLVVKERRRCWQQRRRFRFWTCDKNSTMGIRSLRHKEEGDDAELESIDRGHACRVAIVARKLPRTTVSRAQEGCLPSETPQASCAGLAAHLHNRRSFAIYINRRPQHTTWPSATTSRQSLAMHNVSKLWQGMRAVLGLRARPGPDRHTPWAKARPNGAQRRITPRHRPQCTTSRKLEAMMLEEGKPMFWQFLVQRLLRLRPFRTRAVPARQDHGLRTVM